MFKYIIFFILSISFSKSQNNINIDNFYFGCQSNPFITFDHLNNTSYAFNRYAPNILEDYKILDININASTLYPIGTYNFHPLFNSTYDTVSYSQFEHNRGDFAYYENTVIISNKIDSSTSAFLLLSGRSQPRYYTSASTGNSLQNYIFNLKKELHNSQLSFSMMYHKEDIDIGFNQGQINRASESYMYGFSSFSKYKKISLDASFSSQINRGNYYLESVIDDYSVWSDIAINYGYNKYLTFIFKNKYKKNDIETSIYKNNINYIDNGFFTRINYKRSEIDISIHSILTSEISHSIYSNKKINFKVFYNFGEKTNFSINKKTLLFFNRNNTEEIQNETNINEVDIFDMYSFKIENKSDLFLLSLEPFYISNNYAYNKINNNYVKANINGFIFDTKIKNKYVLLELNSGFYKDESKNNNFSINSYINYGIVYSPYKNKYKYRPFIGINGNYASFKDGLRIEPYSNSFEYIDDSSDTHLINFQIGLILDQFKITYTYMNINKSDVSFSNNSYGFLDTFSRLQINWNFLD